jgi:hypothetical protein
MLMQIKWKWCNGLNRDNLKHKFYITCNLREEALLPSLNILYASPEGLHPNVIFPQNSLVGIPKVDTLVVPKI